MAAAIIVEEFTTHVKGLGKRGSQWLNHGHQGYNHCQKIINRSSTTRCNGEAASTGKALSGKEFTPYRAGWGFRLKTEPKARSNAM